MRVAVISGHYPGSRFESAANHRVYCAQHGYTYINCNWPTGASNPFWNKLEFVRHYLDDFDVVFWIDDDAFFMQMDVGLEAFLPADDDMLTICASPDFKSIDTFISSGQFGLRCGDLGRQFIADTVATDLDVVRSWWTDDLGYFTSGDQDAMTYLLKTRPEFLDRTVIHPYAAFNSRFENLSDPHRHDVFILHFTGHPDVKARNYRATQRLLDRGPSLLARQLDAEWKVIQPPTVALRTKRLVARTVDRARRLISR